jgi:hypothetical protein
MTRSKKSAKSTPSVNVRDLRPKADPKGGATATSDKKPKSTTPTESVSLNFTKISTTY